MTIVTSTKVQWVCTHKSPKENNSQFVVSNTQSMGVSQFVLTSQEYYQQKHPEMIG